MHARHFCSQSGNDNRGSVNRRTAQYGQGDPRGQYPRPRDNQFAQQPRPRVPVRPQLAAPPEPPREEEPRREAFRDGSAQYEQPRTPYVPGYMQNGNRQRAQQAPQEQEQPVMRQSEYIKHQNPYTLMSEKDDQPRQATKRHTLVTLVVIAAVVLLGTWGAQLFFSAQTQATLAARAAAEEAIAANHPFTYRSLIEREAINNNLSPAFVAAIVLNESSFNPNAESYKGARGLMQMMEDTASWVSGQIGTDAAYSFDQMYNAEINVAYGCWYLAYLSDKFGGDPVLVAAAFHSGQTNVTNWLNNAAYSSDQKTIAIDQFPDGNTKNYVAKVMNAFAAYTRLYYEEVTP